jgi:hypothetical protein
MDVCTEIMKTLAVLAEKIKTESLSESGLDINPNMFIPPSNSEEDSSYKSVYGTINGHLSKEAEKSNCDTGKVDPQSEWITVHDSTKYSNRLKFIFKVELLSKVDKKVTGYIELCISFAMKEIMLGNEQWRKRCFTNVNHRVIEASEIPEVPCNDL